jgi:hypothetical protein
MSKKRFETNDLMEEVMDRNSGQIRRIDAQNCTSAR